MKATLNRQLFKQSVFDSAKISATSSVVHQFCSDGEYSGTILQGNRVVGAFRFRVDNESDLMSYHFDLAALSASQKRDDKGDCCCNEPEKGIPTLSSKGYALFFASRGSNYSVQVQAVDGKENYNSTVLEKNDLFALSLIEPVKYSLNNKQSGAAGEIEVTFTKKDASRIRNLETIYVDVENEQFNPANIKLVATQGLVFRIKEKSQIIIQKLGPQKN